MHPEKFAESTLNLKNHSGPIFIFENHRWYLSSDPTVFYLHKILAGKVKQL